MPLVGAQRRDGTRHVFFDAGPYGHDLVRTRTIAIGTPRRQGGQIVQIAAEHRDVATAS